MGLRTPCAGTRPGAADPKRSRAAYPPPRLVVSYIDTELDHKLRKNNREQVIKIFLWPGVRKYWFVVAWRQKILVFSGPG